ncbi:DUF6542 domain-containing protein [Streptoverticillium reticulum]|uniref:DUF6542 domain-containing protein n=1 Tax=Streptoverticillium reticulum TaxID=1433415 RepID=UPI0039BED731
MTNPRVTSADPGTIPAPRASGGPPAGRRGRGQHRRACKGAGRARRALLIAPLLPVLGACVDRAAGPHVGWGFAVGLVLAAVWAGAAVRPAQLWWVVPAPPPVAAAVTMTVALVTGTSSGKSAALPAEAVRWAVDAFPAMAAAQAAVLIVVGVRFVRSRRRGRSGDVRAQG